MFELTACQSDGSLSLQQNARLNSSKGQILGSCSVLLQALVLFDGFCTEFYRGQPVSDSPTTGCQTAGGVWSRGPCSRASNLDGRCYRKNSADVDLVYFGGTTAGPSSCQGVTNSFWQNSSDF